MDDKIGGTFWLPLLSPPLPLYPHAYHAVCTLPCTQMHLSRHVLIMLCGSRNLIHVHRYWFSSFSFLLCIPLFLHLFLVLSPLPLGVGGEPAVSLWEEDENTGYTRNTGSLTRYTAHHLFWFIFFILERNDRLQSTFNLSSSCVCLWSVHLYNHSILHRPPDPFSVCITILQPIMERRNDEHSKNTLHPACHTSESKPCLSTERERKIGRQR